MLFLFNFSSVLPRGLLAKYALNCMLCLLDNWPVIFNDDNTMLHIEVLVCSMGTCSFVAAIIAVPPLVTILISERLFCMSFPRMCPGFESGFLLLFLHRIVGCISVLVSALSEGNIVKLSAIKL